MRALRTSLLSRLLPGLEPWLRGLRSRGLGRPVGQPEASAHRRVRLAMYVVLLIVGGVSAWQTWRIERAEAVRLGDAEVIRTAAAQSTLTQRLGMLAATLAEGAAQERSSALADVLEQAQARAARLEELLNRQGVMQAEVDTPLHQAIMAWQDSRERLWYRAEALLWHAGRPVKTQLLGAIGAFEAELEPSLQASQNLIEQVERAAQQRARHVIDQVEVSALVMLLLLVALVLGVAEPLARFVRRQQQTLVQQSAELQHLALVAQRTSNWVAVLDAKRHVLWCNQAFLDARGCTLDEAVGTLPGILGGREEDQAEHARLIEQLDRGEGVRTRVMYITSGGQEIWLDVDYQGICDGGGQLTGFTLVATDISEQRAQQKLLELAIEGASLGVWGWDIASGAMSCNERLLELYGYTRDTLAMQVAAWNALIHPDDLDGWLWAVQTNLRDSQRPLHWEIRIRNGRAGNWTWMMYSGTVVARDAHGHALRMAGICYDIHAQKELEEQLRLAARTDSLTRLPNRGEVLTRIQTSLLRARRQPGYYFAVLFMDFDRFKQVNDTLGHNVGDELLRQIAERLQSSLRPGDAFVQTSDFRQMAARLGGDEFVVLLDDIRGDLDAQVVASRLLDVLAEPYQIGSHRVSSSVSIGIVTSEHMADDPDSVLRDADIAMYEAKREGRGRYVMFDPSMRKRLRDDVSLENDLRQALDKGELSVAYQPLIDLASGELAGVEALVRWQHPQRGLVSPLDFIPIAEATGLIEQLGLFVLKTACEEFIQLRAELGAQAPASVSVNLSRAQLRQQGFTANLFDVLYATGMSAEDLILEVTESLAAQDEIVQAALREIRAMGIALSLDDFGTGYSSLSCLHQMPVNVVKIDRSFVSQALASSYHRVMIEATIRMAQTLGLATVAEGIENEQQAALMRALGCGKGQGYLYSPPLTAPALVQWASQRCVLA